VLVKQKKEKKKGKETGRLTDRDIDRLFNERVQIFGTIKFNITSPLTTILKVVCKAWVETTRLRWLNKYDLQQLQLDVYALRNELPSSLSHDETKVINTLLDEVLSSAQDRCSESEASLSLSTLQMIYQKQQQGDLT